MIEKHTFVEDDTPAFKRGNRCKICHFTKSDEVHDLEEQKTLF